MTLPVVGAQPSRVENRFHFADLRTGTSLGTLPLSKVKYSTALGGTAGKLTGTLNVTDPQVRRRNPWATCVPRRTALYVERIEHYRARPPVVTVPWGGLVWDIDPKPGAGTWAITAATFESYFAKRIIDADRPYSQVEQTAIHADLLTYFQSYRTGASIRVEANPIATGVLRDRSYLAKDDKFLLPMLVDISQVIGGFDWYIEAYRDSASGLFGQRVVYGYPRLGRLIADGSAVRTRFFADGSGNVLVPPTIKRQGSVVNNEVRALGQSQGDAQVRATVTSAQLGRDEIAQGYPLLQTTYSGSSILDTDTLAANAAALLRGEWASEVVMTGLTLRGDRHPTVAEIALGDDLLCETDDATWANPVTLSARVWAAEVTCGEGDTSEKLQLSLSGDGLTI